MAGKVRYLLNQRGRYHARIRIPDDLRPYFDNKRELKKALGPDRRIALRDLSGVVASFQAQIADAEAKRAMDTGELSKVLRFPMTSAEMASVVYRDQLAIDKETRRSNVLYARHYYPDETRFDQMKEAVHGRCTDEELRELVGGLVRSFQKRGNHQAEFGSTEWREIAIDLAGAELETMGGQIARYYGQPVEQPTLVDPNCLGQ